jgi:hypothetical protein
MISLTDGIIIGLSVSIIVTMFVYICCNCKLLCNKEPDGIVFNLPSNDAVEEQH